MPSPKYQVFFLYNPNTGAPVTGQTGIVFDSYLDSGGVAITPAPAIVEIGGGAYGFIPAFTVDKGIAYVVNTGSGVTPTRVAGYIRPEDYNADLVDVAVSTRASQASVDSSSTNISTLEGKVQRVLDLTEGKWQIHVGGADANRLVIYAADGVTVLKKFDLRDKNGLPTVINPFQKIPV